METYRLNSKLVENNKEYIIQTSNNVSLGIVETEVFVDGKLADTNRVPHPEQLCPEEVMSLVQNTHSDKKYEIEELLSAAKKTLDTANPEMIMNLAFAFYYKKFYEESKYLLQHVINLKPDSHAAYNCLGLVELELGRYQEALASAQKAVGLKPEYADYRNNLGEAFLSMEMYHKAVKEFERAIDINLYYSEAYYNYGLTLLMNAIRQLDTDLFKDFLSKCNDYFSKAEIINPEYKVSEFEKGLIALNAQNLHESLKHFLAVRDYHKELKKQKSAPYYMKHVLHPNLISEKVLAERIVFLQQEIEENPTYVDLYAELARCYVNHSYLFWKKGIEQYKQTLRLNPSFAKIKDKINHAEKALSNLDEAVKNLTD